MSGNHYDLHLSNNPIMRMIANNWDASIIYLVGSHNNILDIGCGEGHTTYKIQKKGHKIIGMDLDNSSLYAPINFKVGDITKIPEKDNSYELVMGNFILEHLETEDLHKAIQECRRVARKACLFSVPHEPFWCIANMMRLAYLKDWGNSKGHIQHFNESGLISAVMPYFSSYEIREGILSLHILCRK